MLKVFQHKEVAISQIFPLLFVPAKVKK